MCGQMNGVRARLLSTGAQRGRETQTVIKSNHFSICVGGRTEISSLKMHKKESSPKSDILSEAVRNLLLFRG